MSENSVYLIDTNVLLFDHQALEQFRDVELVIPLEVIEELDNFKHGSDETARNAREATLLFDRLRTQGSLKDGVKLHNGSTLRVAPGIEGRRSSRALIELAKHLKEQGRNPILVTKRINLRVKADALGLEARDYGQETPLDTDVVRGWRKATLPPSLIATLREGRPVDGRFLDMHQNEYLFAYEDGQPRNACCARFCGDKGELWPLKDSARRCCGLRALNLEQTFALDALLDPSVSLVTLAGRAGTGKTLVAIAAALQQIFGEKRYEKLLVFRPTVAVSRDLGFLPGDINDKMRPWMQPVYDALELIRSLDKQNPSRVLPADVMSCQEISVEPLTYIRGRSIPNQFIIIDEAQNLTPLEVKTAITRVGNGSKVVLTGDPAQIDNPYVDSRSNGLTRLVSKFLGSHLAAHITMVKGERSELAETAARLLR